MRNTCIVALVLLILSACGGASYDKKGWEFVLNHLKSPSSAKLVSYVDKNGMKEVFKKADIKLAPCITAEMYDCDAQNGFGAMIRESYVVFFKNGKPCHMEKSTSISKSSEVALKVALEMNGCGCD